MTKQEVMTALECCISHNGHSTCSICPYKHLISDDTPFDCSRRLYKDVIQILGGDSFISIDLDKAIQGGK